MNAIGYRDAGLEAALHRAMTLQADDFGITLKETGLGTRFTELIRRVAATSSHKRVVVLIDEYDKPVIDYLADIQKAENNREIFKTLSLSSLSLSQSNRGSPTRALLLGVGFC
jgi:hypothetical protein